MNIFDTIFYQPLVKALLFLYGLQPAGLAGAVVLLTVAIKIILLPLNIKAIKSQKAMSELQPKLKKIQNKHKNDKEKLGRETMTLYREAGINPFTSIILLVIQTPILIALYRVFTQVPTREGIDPYFLGLNLSASNTFFALAGAAFFFIQTKLTNPSNTKTKDNSDFQVMLQKQMQYFFPVFMFFVLIRVPSAIALYFVVSGLLSIAERYLVESGLL